MRKSVSGGISKKDHGGISGEKTFEIRSISRAADMKAVKSDQFNLKLRYLHMHRAHSIHFEFSDTLVTAIPLKGTPPAAIRV